MKPTPIKELSGDTVDAQPRSMDWSEGYGEKWESYEASACEKCGKVIVGSNGDTHSDLTGDTDCDGHVPQNEGPMMNFFYPLPCLRHDMTHGEAALAIADLPLCVIDIDGEQGLALTGGGMDLSWEICEAYMRLGYLPPLHFCQLPEMCGRGNMSNGGERGAKMSKRDAWIIAGCRRSAQVASMRARWTIKHLIGMKAQPKATKAA